MLILTKSVLMMMLGFFLSLILATFIIPIFRKLKAGQSLSIYLRDAHKKKSGTPTMGGIIFIVPVIIIVIIMFIMKKFEFSFNFLIIIFTFVSYALIGFIDDIKIILKKDNKGLSPWMKFLLQLIVALIFFYLFMISGNEPLLWIHTFHIKLNIGWLYGIIILFILTASSNAVNLTDGLDGLATGLSIIAFLTFGIITWNTGWLEGYEEISLFCFLLVGTLIGFLIFNVSPAKIFMGDTGSLALGATLGAIAILTRHELLLIVIGGVFVLETMSCIIQIMYYKLTKKRVFPMTPIHHTFEKLGWDERDIVKLFWVVGLVCSMIAISFGVWI